MGSMVELLNRLPVEHGRPPAPKYSIETAMAAQGFTAVNGLDRREQIPEATSNRPDQSTTSHARTDSAAAMSIATAREDDSTSRYSSIRNDSVLCPEPVIKQSPETAKRKRLITETIEHPYRDTSTLAGALSPKRRMTDSANKYHSSTPEGMIMGFPNSHASIEPMTRERCSRERSPVPTRNQRTAPPQVRPETQAHLAESLATHLQGVYKDTPEHDGQQVQTHITMRHNKSPSEAYSPEDLGDSSGKRKRNFSNRTKTGCHTCRTRKKKCDEAKPKCNNCERGGWDCSGYGAKPLDYKGPNASSRTRVPLQSKVQDLPQQAPVPHRLDGPRYDHWGQVLPTPTTQDPQYRFPPQSSYENRRSYSRDVFPTPSWQHRESDGAFPPNISPSVDYNQGVPPIAVLDHRHQSHPSMYGSAAIMSPRGSVGTHSSYNPPSSYLGSSETSEKYKMLIGEPYRAHIDEDLIDDRRSCKAAVERWNQAHCHSRATSDDEKGRLFRCILDPSTRNEPNHQYRDYNNPQTRPGSIGARVIIDNPFTCDYGYNIRIGDDAYIGANCTIEDPCDILIGSRVQIGKNVHFCGNVTNDDPASRKGSQSTLTGGAIIVEDDVNIGPGTIILAHRVIGKGASVGAGSVVTKNIPPYTVAAGNPCRVIRSLPRPDSPGRLKRHSRELTTFTTISSVASSSGNGGGGAEDDLVGDRQVALENEQSLREMRARRGIRDQGR